MKFLQINLFYFQLQTDSNPLNNIMNIYHIDNNKNQYDYNVMFYDYFGKFLSHRHFLEHFFVNFSSCIFFANDIHCSHLQVLIVSVSNRVYRDKASISPSRLATINVISLINYSRNLHFSISTPLQGTDYQNYLELYQLSMYWWLQWIWHS